MNDKKYSIGEVVDHGNQAFKDGVKFTSRLSEPEKKRIDTCRVTRCIYWNKGIGCIRLESDIEDDRDCSHLIDTDTEQNPLEEK